MKKSTLLLVAVSVCLTSCQRGCQSLDRDFQSSQRSYEVKVYSGGKLIHDDKFRGILNQEEHSDGLFYFKGDTLIEIGGQYQIKSTN